MSSQSVVRTPQTIVNSYTRKALESAQRLGLSLGEKELQHFVHLIQRRGSRWIRDKAKDFSIMLIYHEGKRHYVVYSKRHKVITDILSESEARINRGDQVWVRRIEGWLKGKVIYVLKEWDNPQKYLDTFRRLGYDTSLLEAKQGALRPQYSYVIGLDNKKVIWPPASTIRKELPYDASR